MTTPSTPATDDPASPPRSCSFRTVVFIRTHLAFMALMAVGIALRAWHLGAIPTPAGDEGNWTWIGLQLLRHRPVDIAPEANFVTRTFGWMIAGAFYLFGPSFATARLVPAVCGLIGATVAYVVLRALKMQRGAVAAAAVMALHPWSVAFSRTTSVPYEVSFAIALCAPLLILHAVERRRRVQNFIAIVLLFTGFQFSPLAAIAVGAVFLDSVRRPRRVAWRWPETWLAVAIGVAITLPVVRSALGVVHATHPDAEPWWGWRAAIELRLVRCRMYLHAMATSLTGDATVREFTTWVLPSWLEFGLAFGALGVVALGVQRTVRRRSAVGMFAPTYLALAFFGVGLMILPTRHWYLNTIDAERYGFAILAPFTLLVAALLEHPVPWRRWVAALFLTVTIGNATARLATYFVVGGGVDHGIYTWRGATWHLGGSGYRWWVVPSERQALPDLVRAAVEETVGRRPVVVIFPDYAFHSLPLGFAWDDSPIETLRDPPTDGIDRPQFFLLWSDGTLSGAQPDVTASNSALRLRMEREYCTQRLVRRWLQPNGAPFVELWYAQPCAVVPDAHGMHRGPTPSF